MTSKDLSTKKRIVDSTISLIMENKDVSKIPISSSTVQVSFLRREVNKKVSGFDFFDEEQRNEFIDILVDLFRK